MTKFLGFIVGIACLSYAACIMIISMASHGS